MGAYLDTTTTSGLARQDAGNPSPRNESRGTRVEGREPAGNQRSEARRKVEGGESRVEGQREFRRQTTDGRGPTSNIERRTLNVEPGDGEGGEKEQGKVQSPKSRVSGWG